MTFDSVRKIGLTLPSVEEGTAYGSPALEIRGKLLACIAIHKSAEPNSLAIRMSFEDRTALIAEDPDTYYLTQHYVPYPVVLVRLSQMEPDVLRDLLQMGRRFVMAQMRSRRPIGSRRSRR